MGGPTHRKTCSVCRQTKAHTTFWNGGDICRACENRAALCVKCGRRKAEKGRDGAMCSTCRKGHDFTISHFAQDIRDRVPFDAHMEGCHATAEDFAAVRRALARYGLRGPTADDVIEEYLSSGTTRMRQGELFHAVVLAANEMKLLGTRALRKANMWRSPNHPTTKAIHEAAA